MFTAAELKTIGFDLDVIREGIMSAGVKSLGKFIFPPIYIQGHAVFTFVFSF